MEERHQAYIKSIREAYSRERDKLDNVLLILSGGTLSVSATFLSDSNRIFTGKGFLVASWVLLLIGLSSLLLAYCFAILHFKHAEKGVQNGRFQTSYEAEANWRNFLVNVCNWISFWATVIGIAMLVYFSYLNLW